MSKIITHPMRSGVKQILERHFTPEIANRFTLIFEAEAYNDYNKNIHNQLRDNMLILEVHYQIGEGLIEYICDIFGWMTPKQAEYKLLRYITDKAKEGKIGKDWDLEGGDKISLALTTTQHETPKDQGSDRIKTASGRTNKRGKGN
jgi:hypothetical protein